MATEVSASRFGTYTNLGKVNTDKWKSKENANDCYWNIAKNQLGEGADNAEIQKAVNEMLELNASKNAATGQYNTVVYENQEILLNLQATIEQSGKEIETAYNELSSRQTEFSSLTSELKSANATYLTYLNQYQEVQKTGDEEATVTAYNSYIQALNNILVLKQEVEKAQEEIKAAQENIEQLNEALKELQEEYEQKENVNKDLKKEFDEQIKKFEEDISKKEEEINSLKQSAKEETQLTQTYQDDAIKSGMIIQDEEGNLSAKNEEQLSQEAKLQQVDNLKAKYTSVQEEQGCVGKFWNGIKNVFGTKYSSKNIEKTIEKVEKGEISVEEADAMLDEYQKRQKSGVDTVVSVATGVATVGAIAIAGVATVATGGLALPAVLAIGGAAGAGTRVGLKTLDRATNKVEGDAIDAKEMTKDAIIGGVEGVVTAATMGMGNAAAQGAKETGKVVVKDAIAQGAKQGLVQGSIDGATTNAATYMADVVTGDAEFSGTQLLGTSVQGAAIGGTVGAVMGGAGGGIKAVRTNSKIDDEVTQALLKEQEEAAKEMGETAIYSAENTTKAAIEEAIEDGQIMSLDDAIELGYSRKQLEDFGLLDRITNTTTLAQEEAAAEFAQTAMSAKNMVIEGFEEKVADGQIVSLDDALKFYSEKELKDAGLYDIFTQNLDDGAADVVQTVQANALDVVTDTREQVLMSLKRNSSPSGEEVELGRQYIRDLISEGKINSQDDLLKYFNNLDEAKGVLGNEFNDITQSFASKLDDNAAKAAASSADDIVSKQATNAEIVQLDGSYYRDSQTGEVYRLKSKEGGGLEHELIDPSSSEYQTAINKIHHPDNRSPMPGINADSSFSTQKISETGKRSMLQTKSKRPQKTEMQEYIEDILNKNKSFTAENDRNIWHDAQMDEYKVIRESGKYARDYGADTFVDSQEVIQKAINPQEIKPDHIGIKQICFSEAPDELYQLRLTRQNGWVYRGSHESFSGEIAERFSANVKASKDMISALDGFAASGQYRNAAGELVKVENVSSFYYKTPDIVSDWNRRQDPLTFYFKGQVNDETKKAIAEITSRYARGNVNNADTVYPWLSNIEINPTNKMVDELYVKLKKYGLNQCASEVYGWKRSGEYAHTSIGLYESFSNIVKYIENSLKKCA